MAILLALQTDSRSIPVRKFDVKAATRMSGQIPPEIDAEAAHDIRDLIAVCDCCQRRSQRGSYGSGNRKLEFCAHVDPSAFLW